jgi:TRAP-type uncharacterized transport system substrate-binding protein
MIRRLSALIIAASMVSVLAVACGGDDPPVIVEVEVAPTATIDAATVTADFKALVGLAGSSFFVEGFREALARGTGGRITWTPQDEPLRAAAIDFVNNRPEEYSRTIFQQNEEDMLLNPVGITFTGGKVADPLPMALFASYPVACTHIFTTDPDIKTVQDLVGKRVHGGNPSHPWASITEIYLKAAGIRSDVTVIIGGKNGNDSLADRDVDAQTYATLASDTSLAASSPKIHQLAQTSGTLNAIGFDLAFFKTMQEQNPVWTDVGLLKPMFFGKGTMNGVTNAGYDIPAQDTYCIGGITPLYMTSPDAEEEIIYQMVKAILDHKEVADEYFPFIGEVWKARMGHAWVPQEMFHPGARRAFDEAGQTFGLEGLEAWYALEGLPWPLVE